MTSFSQSDHLNSYQEFVSYMDIQIEHFKQENLYHDGDSKYENNSISFQNSLSKELNVISNSLNEKENVFSDLDCSTIKIEESTDSEQLSIIEIPKNNETLKSEEDHYSEKEILYLEEKKSLLPIACFHPKRIIEKRIKTKFKKILIIISSLSQKRKMLKKKYVSKFIYKNLLLNVNSIKLVLFYLSKIEKIFDFMKKLKKNTEKKVRYGNIKKDLKVIKSIIRKRLKIINNYLKRSKKIKSKIPDGLVESIYGNRANYKELIKRKNTTSNIIKLRARKKFYKIFIKNFISNFIYHII